MASHCNSKNDPMSLPQSTRPFLIWTLSLFPGSLCSSHIDLLVYFLNKWNTFLPQGLCTCQSPSRMISCGCSCFPSNILVSSQVSSLQKNLFLSMSAKDAPLWTIPYPITVWFSSQHFPLPELILFASCLVPTSFPECQLHEENNLDQIITVSLASRTVPGT